jgi:hypothetical protein
MDYFILKRRYKIYTGTSEECFAEGFWCVNSIVRSKDAVGEDVTTFICSGIVSTIPTSQVVSITPSTPTP